MVEVIHLLITNMVQIVQETVEQLPLATGFVSAYAEVNAEQAQMVNN